MKPIQNVLVLLSIACFTQVAAWDAVAPKPGALELYFNSTGLNNLFQTAVPIGAYFGLDGAVFNSSLKEDTLFYSFDLNKVTVVQASGFTEKILNYDPETNNFHIRIAGIDLQTLIDAEFRALKVIPFASSAVNITNMTIDFKVAAQQMDDHVHWHMNETAKVTIGDINISMKNSFLNWLVGENRKLIDLAINEVVVPYLEKLLTGEVDLVNKLVSGEGPYTFYSTILGKRNGLNFTMTSAPQVIGDSKLVKVFFDGLFVLPEGSEEKIIDFRPNLVSYPPRIEHSLSQQFWINQDTFNSLMEVNREALFPQTFNDSSISDALYTAFPTLNKTCNGVSAYIAYTLAQSGSRSSQAITFDTTRGVVFGGRNNDVRTEVEVFCAGEKSSVFGFSSQVQTFANITISNFVAYPNIDKHSFAASILTKGELETTKVYDSELNSVGAAVMSSFNGKYGAGWSLANLNPMLAMAAGLIKNTTVSPYATDDWLYAGFEMQADLPNAEEPVLEFIE